MKIEVSYKIDINLIPFKSNKLFLNFLIIKVLFCEVLIINILLNEFGDEFSICIQ